MNETARILCAIGTTEDTTLSDLLVKAGVTLLPTNAEVSALVRTLETLEESLLVRLARFRGEIQSVRLTELGAERAREAMEGTTTLS